MDSKLEALVRQLEEGTHPNPEEGLQELSRMMEQEKQAPRETIDPAAMSHYSGVYRAGLNGMDGIRDYYKQNKPEAWGGVADALSGVSEEERFSSASRQITTAYLSDIMGASPEQIQEDYEALRDQLATSFLGYEGEGMTDEKFMGLMGQRFQKDHDRGLELGPSIERMRRDVFDGKGFAGWPQGINEEVDRLIATGLFDDSDRERVSGLLRNEYAKAQNKMVELRPWIPTLEKSVKDIINMRPELELIEKGNPITGKPPVTRETGEYTQGHVYGQMGANAWDGTLARHTIYEIGAQVQNEEDQAWLAAYALDQFNQARREEEQGMGDIEGKGAETYLSMQRLLNAEFSKLYRVDAHSRAFEILQANDQDRPMLTSMSKEQFENAMADSNQGGAMTPSATYLWRMGTEKMRPSWGTPFGTAYIGDRTGAVRELEPHEREWAVKHAKEVEWGNKFAKAIMDQMHGEGGIHPPDDLHEWGFAGDAAEFMGTSLGYTALFANWMAGLATTSQTFAAQNMERTMEQNPNADIQVALRTSQTVGAAQAGIELAQQIFFRTGRLVGLEGFMNKWAAGLATKGTLTQFGTRAGLGLIVETGEELGQHALEGFQDDFLHALNEDYPEVDWEEHWAPMLEMTPAMMVGMLPMVLWGAGVMTVSSERPNPFTELDQLLMLGVPADAAQSVLNARNEAHALEVFQGLGDRIDPSSESAALARSRMDSKIVEQQMFDNPVTGPMVRRAVNKNEDGTYTVTTGEGSVVAQSFDQAMELLSMQRPEDVPLVHSDSVAGEVSEMRSQRIDYLVETLEIDPETADFLVSLDPQERQDAYNRLDPEVRSQVSLETIEEGWVALESAVETLREIEALTSEATIEDVKAILDRSEAEFTAGPQRDTARIIANVAASHMLTHGVADAVQVEEMIRERYGPINLQEEGINVRGSASMLMRTPSGREFMSSVSQKLGLPPDTSLPALRAFARESSQNRVRALTAIGEVVRENQDVANEADSVTAAAVAKQEFEELVRPDVESKALDVQRLESEAHANPGNAALQKELIQAKAELQAMEIKAGRELSTEQRVDRLKNRKQIRSNLPKSDHVDHVNTLNPRDRGVLAELQEEAGTLVATYEILSWVRILRTGDYTRRVATDEQRREEGHSSETLSTDPPAIYDGESWVMMADDAVGMVLINMANLETFAAVMGFKSDAEAYSAFIDMGLNEEFVHLAILLNAPEDYSGLMDPMENPSPGMISPSEFEQNLKDANRIYLQTRGQDPSVAQSDFQNDAERYLAWNEVMRMVVQYNAQGITTEAFMGHAPDSVEFENIAAFESKLEKWTSEILEGKWGSTNQDILVNALRMAREVQAEAKANMEPAAALSREPISPAHAQLLMSMGARPMAGEFREFDPNTMEDVYAGDERLEVQEGDMVDIIEPGWTSTENEQTFVVVPAKVVKSGTNEARVLLDIARTRHDQVTRSIQEQTGTEVSRRAQTAVLAEELGYTMGEFEALPIKEQFQKASERTQEVFGFAKVSRGEGISLRDATDMLMDMRASLNDMAAALQIPLVAMGNPTGVQGGEMTLVLHGQGRNKGTMGSFDEDTGTLHIYNRNNVFAHEWAHSLHTQILNQMAEEEGFNSDSFLGSRLARIYSLLFGHSQGEAAMRIAAIEHELERILGDIGTMRQELRKQEPGSEEWAEIQADYAEAVETSRGLRKKLRDARGLTDEGMTNLMGPQMALPQMPDGRIDMWNNLDPDPYMGQDRSQDRIDKAGTYAGVMFADGSVMGVGEHLTHRDLVTHLEDSQSYSANYKTDLRIITDTRSRVIRVTGLHEEEAVVWDINPRQQETLEFWAGYMGYELEIDNRMRRGGDTLNRPESAGIEPGSESSYYENLGLQDQSKYWQAPSEMFARAVEAYVADQISRIEGRHMIATQEDRLYSDRAMETFSNKYPQGTLRDQVFEEIGELMSAVRQNQKVREIPETMQDANLVDLEFWTKEPTGTVASIIESERSALRRWRTKFGRATGTEEEFAGDSHGNPLPAIWRTMRLNVASATATMRAELDMFRNMIYRNNPRARAALTKLKDMLTTSPGEMRFVGDNVERLSERRANQTNSAFMRRLRKVHSQPQDMTRSQREFLFRILVGLEQAPEGANAAEIRELTEWTRAKLNEYYTRQRQAGIELGFLEDANYLPMVYDSNKAFHNQKDFIAKATAYYTAQNAEEEAVVRRRLAKAEANNDTAAAAVERAELDEIMARNAAEQAEAWLNRMVYGDTMLEYENQLPALPKNTKARSHSTRLTFEHLYDYVINDPVDLFTMYSEAAERRIARAQIFGPENELLNELLIEARDAGVHPEDMARVKEMVKMAAGNNGMENTEKSHMVFVNGFSTLMTMAMLPRASWASVVEPWVGSLRTGDFMTPLLSMLEWAVNHKGREAIRDITEITGVLADHALDEIIAKRFGGTYNFRWADKVLSGFFKANLLTQITRAQRRLVTRMGIYHIRKLSKKHQKGDINATAELQELGVENVDAFAGWMTSFSGIGTAQEIERSPHFNEFSRVMQRFTDEVIQNPSKFDRAYLANKPGTRFIYAITGFNYSFFDNALRGKFDSIINSEGALAKSRKGAEMVVGIGNILFIATVVAGLRKWLLHHDAWMRQQDRVNEQLKSKWVQNYAEEYKAEYGQTMAEKLGEQFAKDMDMMQDYDFAQKWFRTAFEPLLSDDPLTRAGGFSRGVPIGFFDTPLQMVSGVRFQRDPATSLAGAHVGYVSDALGRIINLYSSNSENSNNAERAAFEAMYDLTVVPAIAYAISRAPAGPVSNMGRAAALQYFTGDQPAKWAATKMFGEPYTTTDAARKMAEENGIRLRDVKPSGNNNRILVGDVQVAILEKEEREKKKALE